MFSKAYIECTISDSPLQVPLLEGTIVEITHSRIVLPTGIVTVVPFKRRKCGNV